MTLRPAITVGILLVVVGIGGGWLVSIAGRKGLSSSNDTYLVHMTFEDAGGLAKRSRIVEAGIDIGKLEKIELVNRKARVTVRISKDVPLYEDASVVKRSEGLLGDSLLDIDPGSETKPRLVNDGEIKNATAANGMDQVMSTAQRVATNTEKITGSIADTVGSDQGKQELATILKQLAETSVQINRATMQSSEQLSRILGHLERLTGQISQLAPDQEKQLTTILANVKEITDQTKLAVAAVNTVIDKQGTNVDSAMKQVHDSLDKLDKTLASAQDVVQGIDQGQGPVGMLLRDKQLADQIKHTATEATAYVDRLTGLKLQVVERSELHVQPRGNGAVAWPTVHTFGAKLIPDKSSRYVGFDIVSDTRGQVQHQVQVINGQSLLTDTWSEAMRYDAYLGQHLGPATFRIGLIESTGGVGADLDVVPNLFSLHADAFDFTPVNLAPFPRVRVSGQLSFLNNFDVYVGGDDLMNGPAQNFDPHGVLTGGGRTVFAGAGFHLTDDDLKAILSSTGIPKM